MMRTLLRQSAIAVTFVAAVALAGAQDTSELATIDGKTLELAEGWYVRIDTGFGPILAILHPKQAPQSVAHFAALAEGLLEWSDPVTGEKRKERYYDGVKVHRVVAGRQFEVGQPDTESGMPPDLFVPPSEVNKPVNFSRPYKLGMTRGALSRISGVTFFVTADSLPYLNHRHPCFGTVIHGKETVFRITGVKAYSNGRPLEGIEIRSVRVFSVGDPDPLPKPLPFKPKAPKLEMRKG